MDLSTGLDNTFRETSRERATDKNHEMIAIYAATVIVSACLLFLVQPLITKIIFPWFGGTSAIWIAALVFFQVCLLCGYAYAHGLVARLSARRQSIVHSVLLVLGCALMPILPADAWRPTGGDPTARIFLLLAATVGLPSILLSSTSPLLQAWYVRERGTGIPLWLFALSNAGSLIALLSFPLVLEPTLSSTVMAIGWSVMFVVFAAMCIYLAWRRRLEPSAATGAVGEGATAAALTGAPLAAPSGPARELQGADPRATPGLAQMASWMTYSACGSALLAAATVQLTTNIAPVPLLWVVPLALYLLSFVLTFASPRLYQRRLYFPFVAAALVCMAWMYTHGEAQPDIQYVIPLYLLCLFVVCMACHGELVLRRPHAAYLTRFYLLIALGGALGGVFVSIVSPALFDTYLEMPLLLILIAELMVLVQWRRRGSGALLWPLRIAMIAGVVSLAGYLLVAESRGREQELLVSRNFYGVLRIRDYVFDGLHRRSLIHGTIDHGYQLMDPAYRDVVASYYGPKSAIGRTWKAMSQRPALRVGIVGLGAGVLTGFAREGDYFRVYEINPDVLRIAQEYFTFLSRARERGADVQVLMGDARLTLERQAPQNFDLLIIDAFSSDAIPVHLLTNEAAEVYFRHLRPDGVLAVHISNRYLDLAPVCARAAEHVGRSALILPNAKEPLSEASVWALITSNLALLQQPEFADAPMQLAQAKASFRGWSDSYSSLWPVLTAVQKGFRITDIQALGPMQPSTSSGAAHDRKRDEQGSGDPTAE